MSRPNPTSPVKRGPSVKSGFNPGPSKAPKASFSASDATTGHLGQPLEPPADFHPHPLPYGDHGPSTGPMPQPPPAPRVQHATGGRAPAGYEQQPMPQMDLGVAYIPPGVAEGYGLDPVERLLRLLAGGYTA